MKRLAILLAFLPPASATMACNCPDAGSYAEFSAASMARNPQLQITGDARVECMHRNVRDQCDGLWILPGQPGVVTVTLVFPDGTSAEDSVDYLYDGHYPCRGDLRPVRDKVIRL
jgi:hypothetical protein